MKALVGAPAVTALAAQQAPPPARPPLPSPASPGASSEQPKIEVSYPDSAAETVPRFFSSTQLRTLRKLGDLIMPKMNGAAGASEAKAAEFLDFLLGESGPERQSLYKGGLDALHGESVKRFHKAFDAVTDPEAATLLAPLNAPWTYEGPKDILGKFLAAARSDIRTATLNSAEYAASAGAGRRFGGQGMYWRPLD